MKQKKMGKWTFTTEEMDRQFEEASRRGEEALKTEPRAKRVSYDGQHRRLAIELYDGTLLGIPVDKIQGLASESSVVIFPFHSLVHPFAGWRVLVTQVKTGRDPSYIDMDMRRRMIIRTNSNAEPFSSPDFRH